jgi:hypothetical protein
LIFIFWPLETERALDASVGALLAVWVEFCPKANGERASANPKASAIDRNVFAFMIRISLLIFRSRRAALSAPENFEFDDELLNQVVCRTADRFRERRVNEPNKAGAHQLELTNSIERCGAVKILKEENADLKQLLGIH